MFTACTWIAAALAAGQPPAPEYPCHRVAAAVTIDGTVQGEAVWATLPAATGFYKLGGGYTLAKQTVFRMGWDDAALYVAIVCEEPDAALLKPRGASGDNLYQEDSVELFLMLPGRPEIYQFMVAPGGAHTAFTDAEGMTGWTAAATRGKTSWSAEIRLPWRMLGRRPKAKEKWRGHVGRNILVTRSGGDRFTTSAPLRRLFHEPDNFTPWVFEAGVLTAAQADRVAARINAPYRAKLVADVQALIRRGNRHRTALERSLADPAFAVAAKRLRTRWRRVRDLKPASAPLFDLRRALAQSQALVDDTYTHCYRFLIEDLFRKP